MFVIGLQNKFGLRFSYIEHLLNNPNHHKHQGASLSDRSVFNPVIEIITPTYAVHSTK